MKEDFLHYVWKHQKFSFPLTTQQGQDIEVLANGWHNKHAGPDFSDAQILLDDLRWAGAVALHLRSSDWYRHGHQHDPAYDNVILHVVWEDDIEVCRNDGSLLPTLVLKSQVSPELLDRYSTAFSPQAQFIPCETEIDFLSKTNWLLWKERLYIECLEERSKRITQILGENKQDWEATLFVLLARNFGLNVNGEGFSQIAQSFPFAVVRKLQQNSRYLEALFIGQAGLIPEDTDIAYPKALQADYRFLKQKFGLKASKYSLQFARLRPHNFPTIRWVQLAQLYAATPSVFSKLFNQGTLSTHWMEKIGVSSFWKNHYTFAKSSRSQPKKLTLAFIDLLKINTLIPFYFTHQKALGKDASEQIVAWIRLIKLERNSLVDRYKKLGVDAENALDSQALIHLYKNYCQPKKCLLCAVGNQLMKQK